MGEDPGLQFPREQFVPQSPNSCSLSAIPKLQQQKIVPKLMNPGTNMLSPYGATPGCPHPQLPGLQSGQVKEPRGWFYCLPRVRKVLSPPLDSCMKGQLPVNTSENYREITPKAYSGSAQKRFLVFDQSGDQTTLIFTSGMRTSVHNSVSWNQNLFGPYNLNREAAEMRGHDLGPGTVLMDKFDNNNEPALQSETHEENSEELDALLYSDDDSDYTEGDEVTSTGHSPSSMTTQDGRGWFIGDVEEVASSGGPTKKRKLLDDGSPSEMDTASSMNPTRYLEYEDEAESSCADCKSSECGGMGLSAGNRRMRKEKIRETLSVLRSIIPDGKGKEAIAVLDEAIHYLKSLKHKAAAVGLNTL